MNLLLDTHVVLWWYENPRLINDGVRKEIENTGNDIFISAVVFWECSIKTALGKLIIPEAVLSKAGMDFSGLPITSKHAREIIHLPLIHQDPFDRLLIAQAKIENLTLVTRDKNILRYADIELLEA